MSNERLGYMVKWVILLFVLQVAITMGVSAVGIGVSYSLDVLFDKSATEAVWPLMAAWVASGILSYRAANRILGATPK